MDHENVRPTAARACLTIVGLPNIVLYITSADRKRRSPR